MVCVKSVYGIFSNTTFSVFHVAVCVPPYTQATLLKYNTFKILYNVLFMIYTHWTTIMFEDIIKVLAVRFLLLTGFCFNKKDPVTIYQFLYSRIIILWSVSTNNRLQDLYNRLILCRGKR